MVPPPPWLSRFPNLQGAKPLALAVEGAAPILEPQKLSYFFLGRGLRLGE